MPNGEKIYIGANPRSNDRQETTDRSINMKPGPQRIPRMWYQNMLGMIDSDVNAFPTYNTIPNVGGGDQIDHVILPGHTRIPKWVWKPNGVGSNLSDDTMQVDAFSVAGPL